ncbi:MAG: N5-carboxyaminoimidazole ribonucleotide synthase [Fimbriimonadales bacterium]|nr:5-(carboxyamino)imidazole ribonucleotide synthase [Armatimonadota bacterium]MBV6502877.1 N5-carboxyaminoimidazole ribonucleotide synthase [Fimbriimonadales bacterium]NOG93683.1 5-(carboxyamino)imidazole ribonucleotide synthase [Armatimonadota bacterium]
MRVGVLGGGQLGRMLGIAGVPMGLQFRFLDPSPAPPAAAVGECVCAAYDDEQGLQRFLEGIEVATYEFENVPASAAKYLEGHVPVFPGWNALEVAQDRLHEKRLFEKLGIPCANYCAVETLDDLKSALTSVAPPCILKTRRHGYDGKGQHRIERIEEAEEAWLAIGEREAIVESLVEFDWECSVLCVRSKDGTSKTYPIVQNYHRGGILRTSHCPPAVAVPPDLEATAVAYASRIAHDLEYVGVLALEMFSVGGRLLANELAPRVHNSGHWTIEGAECSQFENHLRAVLGWPLGSTEVRGYSAMVNLIGQEVDPCSVLSLGAHYHWYGKEVRPGRKVGHITVVEASAEARDKKVSSLQERIAQHA